MTGRVVEAVRSVLAQPDPILVFLAGPNGAGKSTFFEVHLRPDLGEGLPFINADEIGAALRELEPTASAEHLDRLAFERAEELRRSFATRHVSFCTETVLSDPHGAKLAFLRSARQAGYVVFRSSSGSTTRNCRSPV